jgi:hypothetical protein
MPGILAFSVQNCKKIRSRKPGTVSKNVKTDLKGDTDFDFEKFVRL